MSEHRRKAPDPNLDPSSNRREEATPGRHRRMLLDGRHRQVGTQETPTTEVLGGLPAGQIIHAEQAFARPEIVHRLLEAGRDSIHVRTRFSTPAIVYRSGELTRTSEGYASFGTGVSERILAEQGVESWKEAIERKVAQENIYLANERTHAEMVVFTPLGHDADTSAEESGLVRVSYAFGAIREAYPQAEALNYRDSMGRAGNNLVASMVVPHILAEEFFDHLKTNPRAGRVFAEAGFRASVPLETAERFWTREQFGMMPPYGALPEDAALSLMVMSPDSTQVIQSCNVALS